MSDGGSVTASLRMNESSHTTRRARLTSTGDGDGLHVADEGDGDGRDEQTGHGGPVKAVQRVLKAVQARGDGTQHLDAAALQTVGGPRGVDGDAKHDHQNQRPRVVQERNDLLLRESSTKQPACHVPAKKQAVY